MRVRLLDSLEPVSRRRFLVYLMGPYRSFGLDDLAGGLSDISTEWRGDGGERSEDDVLEFLRSVRDRLRKEGGLNAFLAIDVGIPIDEMDAATQSIRFAKASQVIAFVAPAVGKNLGVGIEVGAVLEGLPKADQERIIFVHEEAISSAMIASLPRRWDVTVHSYDDEDSLVDRLREFAVAVMNLEATGELPPTGLTVRGGYGIPVPLAPSIPAESPSSQQLLRIPPYWRGRATGP